jgi:hypothetical protein
MHRAVDEEFVAALHQQLTRLPQIHADALVIAVAASSMLASS